MTMVLGFLSELQRVMLTSLEMSGVKMLAVTVVLKMIWISPRLQDVCRLW